MTQYIKDAICNLLLQLRDDDKLTQKDVAEITKMIADRCNKPLLKKVERECVEIQTKLAFTGVNIK